MSETRETQVPPGRTVWRAVGHVAVCLVLAGTGVAAVGGAGYLMGSREPHIDFTDRVRSADTTTLRPTAGSGRLRFAVATMVSAEATFSTYRRLVQRICRDVGRREAFIVRPSYAAVRKTLETGQVDVALVCTGTYVHSLAGGRVKLLVQPVFEPGLEYRCLIIVPAKSDFKSLEDLRGRVMAFTDPESNTGCLVPSATFMDLGHDPKSFFKKVVFTGSHDRSIHAAARSVVDAAAVDALVWESNLRENPSLGDRVRIIWRSEPFGPPPIVVPAGIDGELARSLREAFLTLHEDEDGRRILAGIGIRQFQPPNPESYKTAVELHKRLKDQGGLSWP